MDRNLPAKKVETIRELLESTNVQTEIARALPGALTADQLMRATVTLFRTNDKLLQCSQMSLLACFFGCAQLGLTPDPWLGQVYFVPFWNKNIGSNGCLEATLIPGYRGLITLSRRSGFLESVDARAIYDNDFFEVEFGSHPHLSHRPAEKDPGELRGAWTCWKFKSGHQVFDYMSLWEIDKIMERTKSRNRAGEIVGPWVTDKPEMAKKSVIRRLFKLQPVSIEDQRFSRAIAAEDMAMEIGPGAQRNLFLPEIKLPDAAPGPDDHKDFEESMGAAIIAEPVFAKFMAITAKANNISLTELESEALGDIAGFKTAYAAFKTQNGGGGAADPGKAPAALAEEEFIKEWNFIRNPEVLIKYVAEEYTKPAPGNAGTGAEVNRFLRCSPECLGKAQAKYSRIAKKPWPQPEALRPEVVNPGDPGGDSAASLVSVAQKEAGADITFDEVQQSDAWQEMSVLKEKHPVEFKNITGGVIPRTMGGVLDVVAQLYALEDKAGEEIPGA